MMMMIMMTSVGLFISMNIIVWFRRDVDLIPKLIIRNWTIYTDHPKMTSWHIPIRGWCRWISSEVDQCLKRIRSTWITSN